jgi:serine/threonine protein kinase, bacterial
MADGGFLIGDTFAARVRQVSPAGTITTVAGNGTFGFSGDGGPATAAQLSGGFSVAATPDGGFLIADTNNFRIRPVSPTGLHLQVFFVGATAGASAPLGTDYRASFSASRIASMTSSGSSSSTA